jgi:hypothetical protein
MRSLLLLLAVATVCVARGELPPMGWMSWEIFRCEVDCGANPTSCINEQLYKDHADRLAADGFVTAGASDGLVRIMDVNNNIDVVARGLSSVCYSRDVFEFHY